MIEGRLCLKRVYESPLTSDGVRVLVDRLWPRGVKKQDAQIAVWLKDIAPSTELRKWFGHDRDKFADFRAAYELELSHDEQHIQAISQICEWLRNDPVTLVYAARDTVCNNAVVLFERIDSISNH